MGSLPLPGGYNVRVLWRRISFWELGDDPKRESGISRKGYAITDGAFRKEWLVLSGVAKAKRLDRSQVSFNRENETTESATLKRRTNRNGTSWYCLCPQSHTDGGQAGRLKNLDRALHVPVFAVTAADRMCPHFRD